MDTDRWDRIQHLYHAALELPSSGRADFLAQSCSNDSELLREVESMLAFEGRADALLEKPLLAASMGPGSQLGPFRIEGPIGEGGMGTVYRATDTRLDRAVAIKMLPAAYAHQPKWIERFQREARAISALNHPSVCTLYDVGPNYLVMELVEGAPPAAPLPVETAIEYARQILAGLEAAHERGIVHRDLKPANLLVTSAGKVKILDFGLAKAIQSLGSGGATSADVSEPGVVLGTAAYMAPEQARGEAVDRRADLWAFGVILFELLTGKKLFGESRSTSDTLAAVLTREPDFGALPANTPARVRRVLELCLRKDPRQRLRDALDAQLILDDKTVDAGEPAKPVRRWVPWSIAAVLALGLLGAGATWLGSRSGSDATVRFPLVLPSGTSAEPHILSTHALPSPDGRLVVIAAQDGTTATHALWVRALSSDTAKRLEKTEGASLPFWSPDSRYIGFYADDKLKRVALFDGDVQTICNAPRTGDGATWGENGEIIFSEYGPSPGKPLMRVAATGGTPTPVTTLSQDERWHSWPQWLPGGLHVLYFSVGHSPAQGAVYVQEVGSNRRTLVMQNATRAIWAEPGYLLFVREGTLFAQRINSRTFKLEGEPAVVAKEVAFNAPNGRNAMGASNNGVLVYRSSPSRMRQLRWYDREGKPAGILSKPGEYMNPTLSPDGKSVAVMVGPSGRIDLWVIDLASGVMSQVTHDREVSVATTPVWSPDSRRVAIARVPNGFEFVELASGRVVRSAAENVSVHSWSPDGAWLLCNGMNRLWRVPAAESGPRESILETKSALADIQFSTDGRSVVYFSSESGTNEIWGAAFPSFTTKRKISSSGGRFPRLVKHGREVVYRAPDGAIMSVALRMGPTIEAGAPMLLFKASGADVGRFSVTPDGERFLIDEPADKFEGQRPDIMVVLNWASGLR